MLITAMVCPDNLDFRIRGKKILHKQRAITLDFSARIKEFNGLRQLLVREIVEGFEGNGHILFPIAIDQIRHFFVALCRLSSALLRFRRNFWFLLKLFDVFQDIKRGIRSTNLARCFRFRPHTSYNGYIVVYCVPMKTSSESTLLGLVVTILLFALSENSTDDFFRNTVLLHLMLNCVFGKIHLQHSSVGSSDRFFSAAQRRGRSLFLRGRGRCTVLSVRCLTEHECNNLFIDTILFHLVFDSFSRNIHLQHLLIFLSCCLFRNCQRWKRSFRRLLFGISAAVFSTQDGNHNLLVNAVLFHLVSYSFSGNHHLQHSSVDSSLLLVFG
mmetsp:Transcript_22235/g.55054  ORF Transcript_22235/g.55054 Transcript_22235/m.55054 type:complete len:327 (-) Transcript_22235:2274-3254(-)